MANLWMFLQQTVAAALVALFLLALQRIFLDKLSPRWQYGVWLVLLLRLVVPVGFGGRATVLDVSLWVETLRAQVELGLSSAYSSPFLAARPLAPVPLPPAGAPASWTDWLFLLYLAGVALSALWFVLSAWRLARRVGQGVPVEGARREAVEELARRCGLPCPRRMVECRWDRGPLLMGVLRPTLVLPMGWETDEKVILHELLHLKHHDVAAGWVTTAFRCLHWCNPVLWLVFDKVGNDREALCDQRVLERLEGEARRDYGRALLSMADDRCRRTPGATSMANGARAVKARIQAIARFRLYPQGMELVSGCIVLALSLSLVVGVPAAADLWQYEESGLSSQLLAVAARNRPTTVAGALDAYGTGFALAHRWTSRANTSSHALLLSAMAVPPDQMSDFLAELKDTSSLPPALRQAKAGGGPFFRGLISDGEGGYLCQVFWLVQPSLSALKDLGLAEDGLVDYPWPVAYLCHTVRVRPMGQRWTVEPIARTSGWYAGSVLDGEAPLLYGPVTWSGQAEGISVELSYTTALLTSEDLFSSLQDVNDYQTSGEVLGTYAMLRSLGMSSPEPDATLYHTSFSSMFSFLRLQVENLSGGARSFHLEIVPSWDDPAVLPNGVKKDPSLGIPQEWSFTAFLHEDDLTLAPGESVAESVSGPGGFDWRVEPLCIGPDRFTVTLTGEDGAEITVPLTPRYTTPDGGSFSLRGEEGAL